MKKINAVIVDDEPNGRSNLRNLLSEFCPLVEVLAEAGSAGEAVMVIEKVKPDLVFLDIEMPGGSGFDLLNHFSDPKFEVIFCTAYSEHAIRAFRFSALDYLLKPINVLELQAAVKRLEELPPRTGENEKVAVLKENLDAGQVKRIALASLEGYTFARPEDIYYCSADGNYTTFFMTGGDKLMVSKPIKEYETLLSGQGFFRIHASHLINLDYVEKYFRGKGGTVLMANGKELDVSQRRKKEFLARIAGK